MNKNETAIIVLSYNKIRQTRECIDSIIDSGYAKRDIYCFDNGSRPEVYDQLKSDFPEINFNRVEKNRGYSGGFNESMKWVFAVGYGAALFLTNDTRIEKDTDKEILKTAVKTNAGIIAPAIHYLTRPDEVDSAGGYFNPEKGILGHYKDPGGSPYLDQPFDYIPGTALWIDNLSFQTLGGMDETFHTYWEDVDFSFRARETGIVMAKSSGAKILHGVGKTCHKKPRYTTYYFQRNRVRFCKRHLSGALLESCLNEIKRDLEGMKERFSERGDLKRLEYIEEILTEING